MQINKIWQSYPSYRDSGIEWLGVIPEHWDITKVKYGYDIQLGKMLRPEPFSPQDTLEPYLRAANVFWDGVDTDDVKEMWFSPWEKSHYELEPGDLVVCEGGDVGRAAIWEGQIQYCYIQNAVHRVRKKDGYENQYLYYWLCALKSKGYIDLLCSKATIAHFTAEKFKALELISPPLYEQRAIANFLDRETSNMDTMIAKNQRLIELLQEKRTTLISHAVTKGLDPSVPMKDLGIEWLGEIPEHWDVKRVKYISWFNYGDSLAAEAREDGDVPVFGSNGQVGTHSEPNTGSPCIVIGRKGSFGKLNYSNLPSFAIDTTYYVDPSTGNTNIRWLYYALLCLRLDDLSRDSAVPGLNRELAHNQWLPDISSKDQLAIATYLDHETIKIDELIAKVQSAIQRLEEYRTALISAAVTGKIDVTNNKGK